MLLCQACISRRINHTRADHIDPTWRQLFCQLLAQRLGRCVDAGLDQLAGRQFAAQLARGQADAAVLSQKRQCLLDRPQRAPEFYIEVVLGFGQVGFTEVFGAHRRPGGKDQMINVSDRFEQPLQGDAVGDVDRLAAHTVVDTRGQPAPGQHHLGATCYGGLGHCCADTAAAANHDDGFTVEGGCHEVDT